MKKITRLVIMILAVYMCQSSFSQTESQKDVIRCITTEYNDHLRKTYPDLWDVKNLENSKIQQSDLRLAGSLGTIIRIPVVVHVIHNGEAVGVGPNISDAQVLSQIQVLNEDFRRMAGTRGFNTNPVGADTEIEFYLAQEDPKCSPTNGIDRIDMSDESTSWAGSALANTNTETILKPQTIWDRDRYFNIWTVVMTDDNVLGYAQFPNGPQETDGIVINYKVFGSNDAPGVTLTPPFNLGRTATHETGHFLGIFHTFEGGCSGIGDGIDDTPAIANGTSKCPSPNPDTCPSQPGVDMIENYMDYSDDSCMNIFTQDQSAAMRSVLNDPNGRLALATSSVPSDPLPDVTNDGAVVVDKIIQDKCSGGVIPKIELSNYGTQNLMSATLTFNINAGTNQVYNWTGNLAQHESEFIELPLIFPSSDSNLFQISVDIPDSDQRVCNNDDSKAFLKTKSAFQTDSPTIELTLRTDDYAEEISWEFTDSNDNVLYSDSYNETVDDNTTFIENFNITNNECYTFTIFDEAGDGICCDFGNGFYELRTDDNTLITRGGTFESSELTQISTQTLSAVDYFVVNEIRIYPNPTTTELNIKVQDNNNLIDQYEIYNMLGQRVIIKNVESLQDLKLNTDSFNNGMYFIRLYKDGANKSIPFIKR